jgi:hypothetical protein
VLTWRRIYSLRLKRRYERAIRTRTSPRSNGSSFHAPTFGSSGPGRPSTNWPGHPREGGSPLCASSGRVGRGGRDPTRPCWLRWRSSAATHGSSRGHPDDQPRVRLEQFLEFRCWASDQAGYRRDLPGWPSGRGCARASPDRERRAAGCHPGLKFDRHRGQVTRSRDQAPGWLER